MAYQQQQHPISAGHQTSFPTYQPQQQYAVPQGASGTGNGQQPQQQHMSMQPPTQQFATFPPSTYPGHSQQQYHQQPPQPLPGLGYYGAPAATQFPQVSVTVPQNYANSVQASAHMMQSPQVPPSQQPQMHPQFHATPPAHCQGDNGQQAIQSQQPQALSSQFQAIPSQPQPVPSQPQAMPSQPQTYPQSLPCAPLPQPAVDSQVSVLQNIASNLMQQYAQLQHQIVTLQQQSHQQPPVSAYVQSHPAAFAPPNQTFGAPPNSSQPPVLPQFQPNQSLVVQQSSTGQQSQNEAQAAPSHDVPVRTSSPRGETPQSSNVGRASRSSNFTSATLIKSEIPLVDLSDSPEPVHEETWTSKLSTSDISMEHEESKPTSSKRSEEKHSNENQLNENLNENQRGKKRRRSSGIRGYFTPDVAPADDLHGSFVSEGRSDEEDDKVYGIPRDFAVPILKSIREYPELWDPKHPDNRKRTERRMAYEKIAASHPSVTVEQLRFFWDRLRALFFCRSSSQTIMGVDKCHLDFLSVIGIEYPSKGPARKGGIWQRVATALLVEIEKDEVIWNPEHPKNDDFNERQKSWQRIQRKFPKLKVDAIKHFFSNIRYKYMKKLRAGEAPDAIHNIPRSSLKFLERFKDYDFVVHRGWRRYATTAETEVDSEEDEETEMEEHSDGDEETTLNASSSDRPLYHFRSHNSAEEHAAEVATAESTTSSGMLRMPATAEFSMQLLPRVEKWKVLWKRGHRNVSLAARRAAWKAVASDFPQFELLRLRHYFARLRFRYKKYIQSGEDGDTFEKIPRSYLRFLDAEVRSKSTSKSTSKSSVPKRSYNPPKMKSYVRTNRRDSEIMRVILPEIRKRQVLWDVDHAKYYVRSERKKAWEAIHRICPMCTVSEMRCAFQRFRNHYLRYLRRGDVPKLVGGIPRTSLRFLDRFKDVDFNESFRAKIRRNREEAEGGGEEGFETEHEANWSDEDEGADEGEEKRDEERDEEQEEREGEEEEEEDVSSELGFHLGDEAATDDCSGDEEVMILREEGESHEKEGMIIGRVKPNKPPCTKQEKWRCQVDEENVLGDLAEPEEDPLDMKLIIHGNEVVPVAEAGFQPADTDCQFDKLKNEEIWRPTGDDAAPSLKDAGRPAEPVLTITCCDIPTKASEIEYAGEFPSTMKW